MREVNYAGLRMKNPLIVASAESINDFDCMRRAQDAGASKGLKYAESFKQLILR